MRGFFCSVLFALQRSTLWGSQAVWVCVAGCIQVSWLGQNVSEMGLSGQQTVDPAIVLLIKTKKSLSWALGCCYLAGFAEQLHG